MSDDEDVMSPQDPTTPVFRNPDTLRRRAWIERALAGVRRRLAEERGEAEAIPAAAPVAEARSLEAPRLYVVRGGKGR